MSFAIFDENYYLANNPDVKAAVDAGAFSSGRQHFEQYGLLEGRVNVSPFFNEQLYLQKYPDVAAAVAGRGFSSGLQHYIQNGEAEGRSPGGFDEQLYLLSYDDVEAAVAAGGFSSGLQHYTQFGQFEDRTAYFTGMSGNDVLTVAGQGIKAIIGVPFDTLLDGTATAGVGETDTLIGGAGADVFFLGFPNAQPILPNAKQLYVGEGDADYARIQNFERLGDEQLRDYIFLPGTSQDYNLQTINGSLNISTTSGDLIAIVEGVSTLEPFSTADAPVGTLPAGVGNIVLFA